MRSSVENIGLERSDDSDIEDPEYDLELIHPAVGRIEPEVINERKFFFTNSI